MQRHRNYGPRDEAPLQESSDLAFVGVDMRAPPLVQPGYVASAVNKRLLDGVYETRRGLFSPVWGRHASEQFPYRAAYLRDDDAAWLAAYATTYGAGVFSEPAGDTWIVRATAGALLFFRETEIGRIVPYGSGLVLTEAAQVTQNFNELIITRGDDATALRWSGNWTDKVEELVPDTIPSGYAAAPNPRYAFAWRGRTAYLAGRDEFSLSRLADSALVDTDDIFTVNEGRGDEMRAGVPLGGCSVLLLKSRSLHVFTAALADLTDARLDEQPIDLQFDSPMTAVAADGRVWWLDRRGVRTARIAQIDADNKILLQVDVVSDKILPWLRRINWRAAATFAASVTSERIYFAVALDEQTTAQSLLVWNRQTAEWESCDGWAAAALGDFHVVAFAAGVPWLNEPRLFAVSGTGQLVALEFGLGEDHVGWVSSTPVRAAIADELVTRGYTAGTNDPKQILRAQVQIDTWNPAIELEAIFDGPGEVLALGGITRDRTKFFTDLPDFAVNNGDGRFHVARREDYSVVLPGPVPASGNATWAGGGVYTPGQSIFRDTNGRNYTARVGSVGIINNTPDNSPTLWQYIGPDDDTLGAVAYDLLLDSAGATLTNSAGTSLRTSHAPAWADGTIYASGEVRGYLGSVYTCLQAHTAAVGTQPEDNPTLWTDIGEDTSLVLSALFLGAGVRLEDFQTKPERRDIGREACWCQIGIYGTAGANRVRSIALETQSGNRSNAVAA